jgi:hypothetical protein
VESEGRQMKQCWIKSMKEKYVQYVRTTTERR